MVIVEKAVIGGVWFTRSRKSREYHVFGLARLVMPEGSCWRFVIGPYAMAWGFKSNKGGL